MERNSKLPPPDNSLTPTLQNRTQILLSKCYMHFLLVDGNLCVTLQYLLTPSQYSTVYASRPKIGWKQALELSDYYNLTIHCRPIYNSTNEASPTCLFPQRLIALCTGCDIHRWNVGNRCSRRGEVCLSPSRLSLWVSHALSVYIWWVLLCRSDPQSQGKNTHRAYSYTLNRSCCRGTCSQTRYASAS